ncbi:MAG: excinuclease ABC subunit UvrA [Bacteroidota bacterium]
MKNKQEEQDIIYIKNTRVHNLKNLDITIPRDKLIVITGLSGSGKSSLAFDTLYAEGQRRYVESLSAYARQFLGKIDKPAVDYIKGIPPAIAIEQHVNKRNPRSTVGTSTEIYDYLKLLYARIGITYSPESNKPVKKHTTKDVLEYIVSFELNSKILILAPIVHLPTKNTERIELYKTFLKEGVTRVENDDRLLNLNDVVQGNEKINEKKGVNLVIDRVKVKHHDESFVSRVSDSIEIAFKEGHGHCLVKNIQDDKWEHQHFSNLFEADGIEFEEPSIDMFSFNNPLGACPVCEGYGRILGLDEDKIIPNKERSVYEDAVVCWKGDKARKWKEQVIYNAQQCKFPVHKPYNELTDKQKEILWHGCKAFKGIHDFFDYLERKKYKIQNRVMIARYRGKTICPECKGTRLKKEASWVKINQKNIQQLICMSIDELLAFFDNIKLSDYENQIAGRLFEEIKSRLHFLLAVGLKYLTLNRVSSSLSGGESQRINLTNALGSSLVGSLYILDEPSIGLHPRDNDLLIKVLKQLKSLGNTVVVVEHDEDIIKSADEIIDLGPLAGSSGGELVFQGDYKKLLKTSEGLTAQYLSGSKQIQVPSKRRKWNSFIELTGVKEHNLQNIDVRVPLNILSIVSGVSGSGKSSLIADVLYPALGNYLNKNDKLKPGQFTSLKGDLQMISDVEYMDQNPIGKSSRSNPVTYIKAYDEIRKLFSMQPLAIQNNFSPTYFSFNSPGGRCEECQGDGFIKIEMQFMADVYLICETCSGKRFKDEILEIKYKGQNIADVLDLTVEDAIQFFSLPSGKFKKIEEKIVQKLTILQEVGLEYVKLGQSVSTLSGGESQRLKLATFLGKKENVQPTLFIFDEPSTGLHFHDINKLLHALNALIQLGHTVLIIEHNMDIIKTADWIIDLGPEGGIQGGRVVAEGVPEAIAKVPNSYTGQFLKHKF